MHYVILPLPLSLMELPHTVNPRKFWDHGPHKSYVKIEQQQVADTSIVHISSVDAQASLSQQISLAKHKFKDKIFKNFKAVTVEHETLSELIVLCCCVGCMSRKPLSFQSPDSALSGHWPGPEQKEKPGKLLPYLGTSFGIKINF